MAAPLQPIEEEMMMKNLQVDSFVQVPDSNSVVSKDGTSSDATSCFSSTAGDSTVNLKHTHLHPQSPFPNQQLPPYPSPTTYFSYYYPPYDAAAATATAFGGLDEQAYYYVPKTADASHLQYPVMQADNGSLIYLMPGMHPSLYNPYLPVSMVGVDGQYIAQQPYSPSPMAGYLSAPIPYGELVSSPYLWDPSVFVEDGLYQNVYGGISESPGSKTTLSSLSHTRTPSSKNSLPSDFNNQLKQLNKVSTFSSDAPSKGYFQYAKFPSFNQGKGGILYPSNHYKTGTKGWSGTEKTKSRSKINDFDEQNYGPGTTNAKISLTFGDSATGSLANDGNGNSDGITPVMRRDQYNLPDFSTKYDHAFFFVIKSYSEDDIHKSIKYNVWASTPNGNKRLDSAYQEAQDKMAEKGSKCPVFLFFSVNASGQFCGVAEMIGRVDFNKNMDFWQQAKWTGYFPVKWHIIKDVPNPQLRHIIIENNDNKPVTNSRDTQEVRYSQGVDMLNIFKNYVSKTSLLDDFEFYESRQKVMQSKKLRPLMPHSDYRQQMKDE